MRRRYVERGPFSAIDSVRRSCARLVAPPFPCDGHSAHSRQNQASREDIFFWVFLFRLFAAGVSYGATAICYWIRVSVILREGRNAGSARFASHGTIPTF